MSRRRRKEHIVPEASGGLEDLKYDVAQDIGLIAPGEHDGKSYRQALERHKYEIASELGLLDDIRERGWPNMTSRDCGRIGGRLGGRIGGQMVRRMVKYAERNLS